MQSNKNLRRIHLPWDSGCHLEQRRKLSPGQYGITELFMLEKPPEIIQSNH